jgi:hypothetical protein
VNLVTCANCGWVHVLLTREQAQTGIDQFNAYYRTMSAGRRADCGWSKESSLYDYAHCYGCGSTEPMRWFKNGDCPQGVTIQPTILAPSFRSNPLYFFEGAEPANAKHGPKKVD